MTSRPEKITAGPDHVAAHKLVLTRFLPIEQAPGTDARRIEVFAGAHLVAAAASAGTGTGEQSSDLAVDGAALASPDEASVGPSMASRAIAAAGGVPAGAYLAMAIGVVTVVLSLFAGNGSPEFPGASLERALLSHPSAGAADPPDWMFMDPDLHEHVLAANMAEDPESAPARLAGSADGDARPTTKPVMVAAPAERSDEASAVSPPQAPSDPVIPPAAARPGKGELADTANGATITDHHGEHASRTDTGSGERALLSALPPPPPPARPERANTGTRQRSTGAAEADGAPTVLDRSTVVARAGTPKINPVEVQLIAVGRRDQALSAWNALVRDNGDLLGALEPAIAGGEQRGSLFRLRTGPFASTEQARSLCTSLKQRKVDCVVVHRDG